MTRFEASTRLDLAAYDGMALSLTCSQRESSQALMSRVTKMERSTISMLKVHVVARMAAGYPNPTAIKNL